MEQLEILKRKMRLLNFSWNKELLCIVFQPQSTQRAQSGAAFLCVLCALCGFSNQKIIKSLRKIDNENELKSLVRTMKTLAAVSICEYGQIGIASSIS